jgi:hypothetical protein
MGYTAAQYPGRIWDGDTNNPWRTSRADNLDPETNDWDRVVAEVIATQEYGGDSMEEYCRYNEAFIESVGKNWTDLGQQFSQTEVSSMAYLGNGIVLAGAAPKGKIVRSRK